MTGLALLLAITHFVHEGKINEQYLCCQEFLLNTRRDDIFNVSSDCTKYIHEFIMKICAGVCTEGAPGVAGAVKRVVPPTKKQHL
jgi:hypothetical protein